VIKHRRLRVPRLRLREILSRDAIARGTPRRGIPAVIVVVVVSQTAASVRVMVGKRLSTADTIRIPWIPWIPQENHFRPGIFSFFLGFSSTSSGNGFVTYYFDQLPN
jgi:hypothetical protein